MKRRTLLTANRQTILISFAAIVFFAVDSPAGLSLVLPDIFPFYRSNLTICFCCLYILPYVFFLSHQVFSFSMGKFAAFYALNDPGMLVLGTLPDLCIGAGNTQ